MPDQTVQITFSAPNNFTFTPPSATMTAAGKVILHRSPGNAGWTFVSVNELPSPEYSWTITGNGSGVQINDGHTSNGGSHYTVTIEQNGVQYTSGNVPTGTVPPMIMNQ
ncbi:MAG: hypothetical protein M3Z30_00755 [Gemmatimonadota bacterium]|nr:hypothetical protein [Gemmatimonadota bacterium]